MFYDFIISHLILYLILSSFCYKAREGSKNNKLSNYSNRILIKTFIPTAGDVTNYMVDYCGAGSSSGPFCCIDLTVETEPALYIGSMVDYSAVLLPDILMPHSEAVK